MRELSYAVLGRGRWGKRVFEMLREASREVTLLDVSRPKDVNDLDEYRRRIEDAVLGLSCRVNVIWAAVPPGQQDLIVRTLLALGKHVIVEKPWMCGEEASAGLTAEAKKRGLKVGVNYQFCFLDGIRDILTRTGPGGEGATFSGEFTISRENRLSIPPLYNFGSHLMAVRCLYFPKSSLGDIKTGYERPDRRVISVVFQGKKYDIDFLDNKEPLLQRLIEQFESAVLDNEDFPVDLTLAALVYRELMQLENEARR
jgi:hypothetical protein